MSRLIFAGTPVISSKVLLDLVQAGYNIVACLTQPDRAKGRGQKLQPSPVKQCAIAHNIPVLQPESLKKDYSVVEILAQYNADLMIVFAYGLILPQDVLELPRLGCVNIHASLLPRWRGAAPIQHAILAGDTLSGISLMQMDAGLDTGDILATTQVALNDKTNADTLASALAEQGSKLLLEKLPDLLAGRILGVRQDPTLATLAPKINKQDAHLDWFKDALTLDRQVRAFNPQPVAFTILRGVTIRIWHSSLISKDSKGIPGEIINIDAAGIEVSCNPGILRLECVQLPGKKPQWCNNFINGEHPFAVGLSFQVS